MARGECPDPNPDCKYYPDCFSDRHHLYGRPESGIAKRFANLGAHIVQMCRAEHEEIHATEGVLDLPEVDVMKDTLSQIEE